MRAVIQRVSRASVRVNQEVIGKIGTGLLILLGVEKGDELKDVEQLALKVADLRIFEDESGKMNRSLRDIHAAALVVSQFTLLGDCRKGRRPGFSQAALPADAIQLYEAFIHHLEHEGIPTASGRFQAEMQVELVNQGPVTLLLDSRRNF